MQISFIQETILSMNPIAFCRLKETLVGKYISFHTIWRNAAVQFGTGQGIDGQGRR